MTTAALLEAGAPLSTARRCPGLLAAKPVGEKPKAAAPPRRRATGTAKVEAAADAAERCARCGLCIGEWAFCGTDGSRHRNDAAP